MKRVFVSFSLLALAAALGQTSKTEADSAENAVRQADEAWAKAIASKSVTEAAGFYDIEVVTAGTAMPPARGLAAIRAMWAKYFALPDFVLTWKLSKIVVTDSGTIAYSSGNWQGAGPNQGGPYIAVWRKQPDGKWKVLIDSAWFSRPSE
jgi:ketosteroid isomerase-like protein